MSHKPVTINITGGSVSSEQQETAKTTRKCFKTLQHTATDKENLAGRPVKTLKESLTKDQVHDLLEIKRKKPARKKSSPNKDDKITEDDLTNVAGPSENYWQILAEKRRVALVEALDENEGLCKMVEELNEKNAVLQQMLDEANSFVEVFKEMVDDNNDTGIDVKDVSTADETADGVGSVLETSEDVSSVLETTEDNPELIVENQTGGAKDKNVKKQTESSKD